MVDNAQGGHLARIGVHLADHRPCGRDDRVDVGPGWHRLRPRSSSVVRRGRAWTAQLGLTLAGLALGVASLALGQVPEPLRTLAPDAGMRIFPWTARLDLAALVALALFLAAV